MKREFEQQGLVAYICAQAGISRDILELHKWIAPAILHEQVMFAFDKDGAPVGYWTWAFLTADVEQRLNSNIEADLHESEWNEGGALWIIEIVALPGHTSDIVSFIRRSANFNSDFLICRKYFSGRKSLRLSRWTCKGNDDYDLRRNARRIYTLPRSSFSRSYSDWSVNADRPSTAF